MKSNIQPDPTPKEIEMATIASKISGLLNGIGASPLDTRRIIIGIGFGLTLARHHNENIIRETADMYLEIAHGLEDDEMKAFIDELNEIADFEKMKKSKISFDINANRN